MPKQISVSVSQGHIGQESRLVTLSSQLFVKYCIYAVFTPQQYLLQHSEVLN